MPDQVDQVAERLHDEIDEMEAEKEQVAIKTEAIKKALVGIAQRTRDIRDIFTAAAVLLENDIADDTTKAVRNGYEASKKQQSK